VRNLYFEATPLALLAGVVTEAGRLDPASLPELVEERRQQYCTAFQLP
jgi:translation initiation factor 2B subunit (eIF-2B alpha/beta/delta family)